MDGAGKDRPSWIRFAGLGVELASAVAGFTLVGYWVDRHFSVRPWGLLVGLALGLIGGTYNLIRAAIAASKEAAAADKLRGDGKAS